jgi:hypothetical protein
VDLATDFFFSYTYDLTNTLQYNCTMYTRAQHDLAARVQAQKDIHTAGALLAAYARATYHVQRGCRQCLTCERGFTMRRATEGQRDVCEGKGAEDVNDHRSSAGR